MPIVFGKLSFLICLTQPRMEYPRKRLYSFWQERRDCSKSLGGPQYIRHRRLVIIERKKRKASYGPPSACYAALSLRASYVGPPVLLASSFAKPESDQ